jgi:hypothetical protein
MRIITKLRLDLVCDLKKINKKNYIEQGFTSTRMEVV